MSSLAPRIRLRAEAAWKRLGLPADSSLIAGLSDGELQAAFDRAFGSSTSTTTAKRYLVKATLRGLVPDASQRWPGFWTKGRHRRSLLTGDVHLENVLPLAVFRAGPDSEVWRLFQRIFERLLRHSGRRRPSSLRTGFFGHQRSLPAKGARVFSHVFLAISIAIRLRRRSNKLGRCATAPNTRFLGGRVHALSRAWSSSGATATPLHEPFHPVHGISRHPAGHQAPSDPHGLWHSTRTDAGGRPMPVAEAVRRRRHGEPVLVGAR